MSLVIKGHRHSLLGALAALLDLHGAATLGRRAPHLDRLHNECDLIRLGPHLLRDIGGLDIPEDGCDPLLSAEARARLATQVYAWHPADNNGRADPGQTAAQVGAVIYPCRRGD